LENKPNFEAHVFVCTHVRDGKKSCGGSGSAEMRDRVKKHFQQNPDLRGKLRVNSAGCLGQCEEGIASVAYPSGTWLLNSTNTDDQKLIELINDELGL
jgi:predicted metal-binding protein